MGDDDLWEKKRKAGRVGGNENQLAKTASELVLCPDKDKKEKQ